MKIAIFVRRLDSPGGAEKSMKSFQSLLSEENDVRVFSLIDEESEGSIFFSMPIPRQLKILGGYFEGLKSKNVIQDFEPDIILAQHELSYLASRYVRENKNTDLITFLHDYETLYDERFYGRYFIDSIINFGLSFITEIPTKKILRSSSVIVANSEYVKKRYENYYNITADTIYPPVYLEEYEVDSSGEKILHVNPIQEKGIRKTLDMAEKMEEEFLILGKTKKERIREELETLTNVEHIKYVEDMKDVYSKTKVAIMPSEWEEPYGRIPVEAGASGIPCVASDKGGLPESVGNKDAVVEGDQTTQFMTKIAEVKKNYEKYSSKARKNAVEKKAENQLKRLLNIIERVK